MQGPHLLRAGALLAPTAPGPDAAGGTPVQLAAVQRSDPAHWAGPAKASGFQAE